MNANIHHLPITPEYTEAVPAAGVQEEKHYTGESLSTLADKMGKLTCLKGFSDIDPTSRRPRVRHIASFKNENGEYEFRVTDPAIHYDTEVSGTVAVKLGFTESPNSGTGRELHDSIAEQFPGERVITISTPGVVDHCEGLPFMEAIHATVEAAATDSLAILQELAGKDRVTAIGQSMGTIVTNRLAYNNLSQQQLNLHSVIYHAPALVPPENIARDMLMQFPAHVVLDVIKQSGLHPKQTLQTLMHNPIPNPKQVMARAAALAGNSLELIKGTPVEEVEAVAANYRVGVIAGAWDPLYQQDMWDALEQRHPRNIKQKVHRLGGHAIFLNARQAGRDIKEVTDYFAALV